MQQIALLESVVGITRERDRRSLERVLIETLYKFLDAQAVILLRIAPDGDQRLLSESVSLPVEACQERLGIVLNDEGEQRVEPDSEMNRSIAEGLDLTEELDDTLRYLFPIRSRRGVVGLLLVYCQQCDYHDNRFVRAFLDIYTNFLDIIDDNELDTLTGLLNRKTFDRNITELISTSSINRKRGGVRASDRLEYRGDGAEVSHWLGILDIDHFKRINDKFGHIYGDEVLLLFADLMGKIFRSNDILFRYGGEEFVVALPSATEEIALHAFNRFRESVERFDFPQVGRVTVSIGIVQINGQDHTSTVVGNADQALYYAKQHGRNRVCSYHQLIDEGALKERGTKSDIELF